MKYSRTRQISTSALLTACFSLVLLACQETSDPLSRNPWRMVQTIDKDGSKQELKGKARAIYDFGKDGTVKFSLRPDQTLYWKLNEKSDVIQVYGNKEMKKVEEKWKILSLSKDTMRMNAGAEMEYVLVAVDSSIEEVAPELK